MLQLSLPLRKVRMADGTSSLDVVGETEVILYRNNRPYHLSAIVCRNTDTEILAGMPFMKTNDIAVRPISDEIILGGTEFIKYDPRRVATRSIRRITIQSDKQQVILPGTSCNIQSVWSLRRCSSRTKMGFCIQQAK